MRRPVALSLPSFQEAKTSGRSVDFGGSMWDATGEAGSDHAGDLGLLGTPCGLNPQETEDSWALHAVSVPRRPKTPGHSMRSQSPGDPRLLGTSCGLSPQETEDSWALHAF
jgi:hypothetical protein